MKQIIDAIEGDKSIVLNLYALNNTSEDRIKKALALFLKKHDCVQLLDPLYACLKELLINAVRANYKGIFFENFNNNTISSKIIDRRKAMQLFNLEMTRDEARNLARIARANKIKIELRLEIKGTLLNMSVSNPGPIPAGELNAVVDRLNSALKCADLSQFFSDYDNAADVDGHDGMGLVIISMILKNLRVEPDALLIRSQGGTTTARLSIPLLPKVVERYREIVGPRP